MATTPSSRATGPDPVGFAISKIDEAEAHATRALLEGMGAEYEQELAELRESVIE